VSEAASKRFDPISRHMATCVHFTGIRYDKCDAGVAYEDVRDESTRPFRFPCIHSDSATTCDKKATPTREEAEEWNRQVKERFVNVAQARTAAVADAGGKRGVTGSLACPVCEGGELRYGIAGNGHVHGRCTTDDCVAWME
jgi:hypothetical protein